MFNRMRIAIVLYAVLSAQNSFAGFDEGVVAYSKSDYANAAREFRPLAEKGHAEAQYNLGFMYANGQGVPQNHAEAAKWYRLAAQQGDAEAQGNLALMYAYGQGVSQNNIEAVRLYRLAAQQGNAPAQYNLAFMYAKGQGVSQDLVRSYLWLNFAVAQRRDAKWIANRNIVASKMTPNQIAEAQKMERDCAARKLKGCD